MKIPPPFVLYQLLVSSVLPVLGLSTDYSCFCFVHQLAERGEDCSILFFTAAHVEQVIQRLSVHRPDKAVEHG